MKHPFTIALLLITILVACYLALPRISSELSTVDSELTLYCAAGLRKPVSKIIHAYTQETGRKVNIIFNGSGALLSQIKIGQGDLYMPANISYIKEAETMELTAESITTAFLTAVIVVHKDNTNIRSLEDLTKPGVRISFADKTAAIAKFTREILAENEMLKAIENNITVTKPTVNNVVEDVSLGSVDATIAWAAVARNFKDLRVIEVPLFSEQRQKSAIALLNSSKNTAAALHLARYLSAKDKGNLVFKEAGFEVPKLADKWTDSPELFFFSASALTPETVERLHQFEQREGCTITTADKDRLTLSQKSKKITAPLRSKTKKSAYPRQLERLRKFLMKVEEKKTNW